MSGAASVPPPFVLIRSVWALCSTKTPCAHAGSSTLFAMPTGFLSTLLAVPLPLPCTVVRTGREQKDADHNAEIGCLTSSGDTAAHILTLQGPLTDIDRYIYTHTNMYIYHLVLGWNSPL